MKLSVDAGSDVVLRVKLEITIFFSHRKATSSSPKITMSGRKAAKKKKLAKNPAKIASTSAPQISAAPATAITRPDAAAGSPAHAQSVSGSASQTQTTNSSRGASSARQSSPAHAHASSTAHPSTPAQSRTHAQAHTQSHPQSPATTPVPRSPPSGALVGSPLPRASPEEEAQQLFLELAQRGCVVEELIRLLDAVKLPVKVLDEGYLLAAEHGHINVRLFSFLCIFIIVFFAGNYCISEQSVVGVVCELARRKRPHTIRAQRPHRC